MSEKDSAVGLPRAARSPSSPRPSKVQKVSESRWLDKIPSKNKQNHSAPPPVHPDRIVFREVDAANVHATVSFTCTSGELLWGQLNTVLEGSKSKELDTRSGPRQLPVMGGTIVQHSFHYRAKARKGTWKVQPVFIGKWHIGYVCHHEGVDGVDILRQAAKSGWTNRNDFENLVYVNRYDWARSMPSPTLDQLLKSLAPKTSSEDDDGSYEEESESFESSDGSDEEESEHIEKGDKGDAEESEQIEEGGKGDEDEAEQIENGGRGYEEQSEHSEKHTRPKDPSPTMEPSVALQGSNKFPMPKISNPSDKSDKKESKCIDNVYWSDEELRREVEEWESDEEESKYIEDLVSFRFMLLDSKGLPTLTQALKDGEKLERKNYLFDYPDVAEPEAAMNRIPETGIADSSSPVVTSNVSDVKARNGVLAVEGAGNGEKHVGSSRAGVDSRCSFGVNLVTKSCEHEIGWMSFDNGELIGFVYDGEYSDLAVSAGDGEMKLGETLVTGLERKSEEDEDSPYTPSTGTESTDSQPDTRYYVGSETESEAGSQAVSGQTGASRETKGGEEQGEECISKDASTSASPLETIHEEEDLEPSEQNTGDAHQVAAASPGPSPLP